MHKALLTLTEAADRLSIGKTTLRVLIENGEIKTVRIGVSIRVPATEIQRWVESRTGQT